MYKSRKGKSGSTRPHVQEAPAWSNTDKDAVQSTILDLAKAGMSSAQIGTVLRDKHAVPNVRLVLGKRISQVLADNDMLG
jgi:small subunit ribosomal protein S15